MKFSGFPSRRRIATLIRAWTCLCLISLTHAGEMRVFRSAEGKPLKASFQGAVGDNVTLLREDGKSFEIPISKLSQEDQTYISQKALNAGDDAKKLNTAAGHKITQGASLAATKAEDLAQALQLRPESESKYGRSWRLYAAYAKDYQLFGTMPYSVALYSDADGWVGSLSIVYANKGDFGSTAGLGQDHFKGGTNATAGSLKEAMDKDEEIIAKALTTVLGPATVQRYGEGATRRKISRWDWNGSAFILSNEENEYVSLAIVPSATADSGGKSAMMKDGEVKQRLLASVVKSPNSDVFLSEIPMVDQGPKGYCAPATFERAMRTMGLEADMYLLAMIGESKAGGGTSVQVLLENVRSQVYKKGRRTKDEAIKELRIRDIKRYIDQGIPVMWTMCSVDSYNEIANKNTKQREDIADWATYTTEIAAPALELAKSEKPESNHHLCLIIGYNEVTNEIAVSDSWGPRYERRWVPVPVASWVSGSSIFMILP
ncbi:MAG: hypothetical protein WEB53_01540 [Akkermansiaceae bacterium]